MKYLFKYINNDVRAFQLFQLIRTGSLFLISIIFTKNNPFSGESLLSLEEIGLYETFMLITMVITFFWISGMLQSLLSMYGSNKIFNSEKKNPIFFNIFILFTALGIVSAIFVFCLQTPLSKFITDPNSGGFPYLKILLLYILLSCPVSMIEFIYLLKNKALSIIYYGIITFSLQLFCVIIPLFLGYDLEYSLYGLVFINLIRFLWLIVLIYKYSELKISKKFLKKFITLSLPLILGSLISVTTIYFGNFLISYKFDEATFAIFRYGAKELPFVSLLTAAFANALIPTFSNQDNLDNALLNLKKRTSRLMHSIFPVTLLILLTSKYLYPFIFNENFNDSVIIFNIFILIIVTRFIFSRVILIGQQKTKIILYSSIIELLINIILSIIFINIWGIVGIAIATLISNIIEKFYLVIYLRIKENIKMSDYVDMKIYLFYTILLVICFTLTFL